MSRVEPRGVAVLLLLAGLAPAGCGDDSDRPSGTADAAPVPDVDARPPNTFTCAELPHRFPPAHSVCMRFPAVGECIARSIVFPSDECSNGGLGPPYEPLRIHTLNGDSLAIFGRNVRIYAASHGELQLPRISSGIGSSVRDVPEDETVTIDLRVDSRDRRRVTLRLEGGRIELVSVSQLAVLNDCPEGAEQPIPYDCTRDGSPAWEIVDWNIIDAPGDSLEAALDVLASHAWYEEAGVIGPGDAHEPPYATEVSDGVASAGLTRAAVLPRSAWVDPSELLFVGMVVPAEGAPTGASPDFEAGPLLDMQGRWRVDANLYRDGELVDADFDSVYPLLSSLSPQPPGDGYSHVPLAFGESTAFIEGERGSYELQVHVFDGSFNGWDVVIPFRIE